MTNPIHINYQKKTATSDYFLLTSGHKYGVQIFIDHDAWK